MAPRRLVVAALFLVLSTTCSTTSVARLDTGQGQPFIHIPRTGESTLVELGAEKLTRAIAKEVRRAGVSGKEGAKDVPSWAKGERPKVDDSESGKDFAEGIP